MSLESTLEKIKLLENRASSISDNSDSYRKELLTKILLHDYIKVDSRSPLEFYVKSVLLDYLIEKDPFPLMTEELKAKPGAPKSNKADAGKIAYYLFNCNGSIRKTSQLLQIDRKTVKSTYKHAQAVSRKIESGEYTQEELELFSRMNENLFLDEFNADLQRYEDSKK